MKRVAVALLFTLTVSINAAAQHQHPWIRTALPVPTAARTVPNVPQIPSPVPQLSDRSKATIYAASSAFLWGSTAWDAVETDRLVATGRYIEGNPILRRSDGSLNKPLKFSISAVGQIASYYDYKHGHPWRAVIINVVFAAPQFIAAWVSSTRH